MATKGSLNRVMLIGNLGQDPELRTLPDGGSVSNFSVATTETWVDKNDPSGQKREQTEWHRITFFGRMAEILHEYGRKGGKVYIEGTLRTRKWTDKEGIERATTEIRGRDFTFLGSRKDTAGGSGGYDNNANPNANSPAGVGDSFDNGGDDIPF